MGGASFFGWEAYQIVQGKLGKIISAHYTFRKFLKVWWEMKITLNFGTFFHLHCQHFRSSVCQYQYVFWGSLQFKAENWERRKKTEQRN